MVDPQIEGLLLLNLNEMTLGCNKEHKYFKKMVDKYGNGFSYEKTLHFVIPPGAQPGQKIISYHAGDQHCNNIAADLVVTIQMDSTFTHNNNSLN